MKADGPSGQLEYQNHARDLNIHSISITSVNVSGNTATFSGTCTKNGAGVYTFTVTVEDNGEPGTSDKFTITVSGEPVEGGLITKGNIQIHNSTAQNRGDKSTDSNSALALAGGTPSGGFVGRLAELWIYVGSAMYSFAMVMPRPFGLIATGDTRDRSPTNRT